MDEGYRVFEARDIGVVLADIEMPGGMDGLELAGTIRERWLETVILV